MHLKAHTLPSGFDQPAPLQRPLQIIMKFFDFWGNPLSNQWPYPWGALCAHVEP